MIRIGNAAGFWGDQRDAPRRLVEASQLDYLTLEYLAELTLSILAYQRSKDPNAGFVTEFPAVVEDLVPALQQQKSLKIVTNAGGMNPAACAAAISEILSQAGMGETIVAAVAGDDLLPRLDQLQADGEHLSNLETGEPLRTLEQPVISANAYLGAAGIVDALQQGARIVITGRVADASLVVGPAIHEFNWDWDDWEKLGRATVVGHLIECGAQATGGIDSDWQPGWPLGNVGYPIAEVEADGNAIITKPEGTSGRVTPGTLAEQLVYEIGDPEHYLTPDVDADFHQVHFETVGDNRVRVVGGSGRPAPETLKVSMAYRDGYMVSGTLVVTGHNSIAKGEAAIETIRRRVEMAGVELTHFHGEVLGSGDSVARAVGDLPDPWEVVIRIAARAQDRSALERVARELAPLVTAGQPGVTGYTGARVKPHPVMAFWPSLVSRQHLSPEVSVKTCDEWMKSKS